MIYPVKSNLKNQITIKNINQKIKFNPDEQKYFNLKSIKGTIKWDKTKYQEKEIKLDKDEINFLKQCVKVLDLKNEITPKIVDLCIKFKNIK